MNDIRTGTCGEKSSIAVLASGGLDSSVLVAECAELYQEVFPIYLKCGLHWEEAEQRFLAAFLREFGNRRVREARVLEFPMRDVYGESWYLSGAGVPGYQDPDEHWEIPGRNLILLAKAAVWANLNCVGSIALATLSSNPFPDASDSFFAAMERTLTEGLGGRISIFRPFAGLEKFEVIQRGAGLPLELTLSCGDPQPEGHCGLCGKCRERIDAFARAGVADSTPYRRRFESTVKDV